jgi:3-deoxy-D-manno-octulosonic-acid transferase
MNYLYNIIVFLASILLPIIAIFNKKIKLFVDGRKQTFSKIASLKNQEIIWFHVASLGEFEQARPIIEELKSSFSEYKILVTFFSPSGYEIKKNYDLADVICYLPIDSKSNAHQFIGNLQIKFVIFIKYEFWPNFLFELKRNQIPTLLVSGIFRENQLFFKSYGKFMRDALQAFHHFFLQDETSKKLLESIDFKNNTVVGDTRFDRVSKIFQQDNSLDFISEFKNNQYIIVAGSTWKEDEEFLVNYINKKQFSNEKFIIAPHNINKEAIATLRKSIFKKTVLFSEKEGKNLADFDVFIIDTVGILTKIYAAAEVAYVGGGLKTGLHNILEPATFGIPVVIGNKFQKFKEAVDLVRLNGCISVSNQSEFSTIFKKLKQDKNFRIATGKINKNYIQEHLGATQKIMNYLKTKL